MRRRDIIIGRDYLLSPHGNWYELNPGDSVGSIQGVRRVRALDMDQEYFDTRGRPGHGRPQLHNVTLPNGDVVLAAAQVIGRREKNLVLVQVVDSLTGEIGKIPEHNPAWAVSVDHIRGPWRKSVNLQKRNADKKR